MEKIDLAVKTVLRYLTIFLFIVLGLLLFSNVMLRVVNDFARFLTAHNLETIAKIVTTLIPLTSFHWLDEIVELSVSSLVFYGAAVLWVYKGHFSVGDWISERLPGIISRKVYKCFVDGICIAFLFIFFWYALQLCLNTSELSTVFQIPKWVMYSSMLISSLIMLLYSIAGLIKSLMSKDAVGDKSSKSL
ncbi:MAG: TRAP transporter small permease subunit [Elusimicrobiota bacterium]|jgi:TRAP-type C4-dicarboxylate transport system permease small subunit|nr:TRAP transporter small permease subunit [Elusimicrobiota bacterium]